jgi:hypothetical protein
MNSFSTLPRGFNGETNKKSPVALCRGRHKVLETLSCRDLLNHAEGNQL